MVQISQISFDEGIVLLIMRGKNQTQQQQQTVSVVTVLSRPNKTKFSVILTLYAVSQLLLIIFSNIYDKRLVKWHRHTKCLVESFSSSQSVHCSQFITPIFFSKTFVPTDR